jgi:Uma2 family endonuclease
MAEKALQDRMTVDAFIEWAMAQPGGRYELLDGKVYAMSPERVGHARTKARVWQELARALGAGALPCEALPDGLSVPIDDMTSYEPDVLVRCGAPLDSDAVKVPDPLIVVEVCSRSTRGLDVGLKLTDYFKLPSVAHYLLVDTSRRVITHHARNSAGGIDTSIHHEGSLRLDPPGIDIDVAACLPQAD